MTRLTQDDVSRLLAAVQELHSHADFSTLPQLMVALQSQLVPCEISSFTFMDKRHQRAEVVQDAQNAEVVEKLRPQFMAYCHERPVVGHGNQTKDLRALKVTDFVTQEQFERTGYDKEFSKPLDVRFQLIFYLFNDPDMELAMVLNRRSRDFSERDRTVANLLRPHFAQAYQNARAFADLRQREKRTEEALQSSQLGLIFLNGELKVERMTGHSERWLNHYFARRQNISVGLPNRLRRWVEQQHHFQSADAGLSNTRPPLRIEGMDGSLVVRFIQDSKRNPALLLSEQCKPGNTRPRFCPISNLSSRQNDVLRWMVEGKRNSEIGTILGISERTVEKHVAKILFQLEAENRASAILKAVCPNEA